MGLPPRPSAAESALHLLSRLAPESQQLWGRSQKGQAFVTLGEGGGPGSDSLGVSPALPSGLPQPPPSAPIIQICLILRSSGAQARQPGPHDHKLCFFVESGPEKKADC